MFHRANIVDTMQKEYVNLAQKKIGHQNFYAQRNSSNNNKNNKNNKKIDSDNVSRFSDSADSPSQNSVASATNDPTFFLTQGQKLINKNNSNENNFLEQFNQLSFNNAKNPVSSNAVDGNINRIGRMETERTLALNGGYSKFDDGLNMTYNVVNDMTHNNMTPSFNSKDSNPFKEQHAHNLNQRRMELFTGNADRDDYIHKTEYSPLFSPLTGVTNLFGTPVMTDYYESRYMPSKERRGEKLFQPTKVTPGLGMGPNEQAKFGYHDPYRVLPKTVDDLRCANKPKTSYVGGMNHGMKGNNGKTIGTQAKRRPLRYRETAPCDMVKTGGNLSAPAIHGKYDPINMATTARGVAEHMHCGGAKSQIEKTGAIDTHGKSKDPNKQSFTQAPIRNVHLVEGLQARPNHETCVPKATLRNTELNYLGPLGNSTTNKNQVINYNDVPNQNMRNIHGEHDRAGGAIGGFVKNHTINYNDVPNQNMRNIHGEHDRAGGAIGGFVKNQTINYNDVPNQNMRNIHGEYDRAGGAVGGFVKNQTVNYNDVPNQNMRNVHGEYDRAGGAVGGFVKNQTVNYNDVPDATMRNIHNYDDVGVAGSYVPKNKSINYNDVPDVTMRNIHNYDDVGVAGSYVPKNKSINYNDVPDATMRNIHNYDDVGVAGSYVPKNKTIDYNDVPDVTMREIHGEINHYGTARGTDNLPSRHSAYTSSVNTAREEVMKGRAPTLSNYNKGYTQEFTEYNICDKTKINIRNPQPYLQNQTTDHLTFATSVSPNARYYVDNRKTRELLKDTLEFNPYINNVEDKAEKIQNGMFHVPNIENKIIQPCNLVSKRIISF